MSDDTLNRLVESMTVVDLENAMIVFSMGDVSPKIYHSLSHTLGARTHVSRKVWLDAQFLEHHWCTLSVLLSVTLHFQEPGNDFQDAPRVVYIWLVCRVAHCLLHLGHSKLPKGQFEAPRHQAQHIPQAALGDSEPRHGRIHCDPARPLAGRRLVRLCAENAIHWGHPHGLLLGPCMRIWQSASLFLRCFLHIHDYAQTMARRDQVQGQVRRLLGHLHQACSQCVFTQ